MNHSPKRAFGSTDKARRKQVNLSLTTARKMLPLVRGIVRDILETKQQLNQMHPERDRLDRHRHDLVWQERERRYHLKDDILTAEKRLTAAMGELKSLGLSLADDQEGRVEFPTRIHGRPAAFCWKPDEDELGFWHYVGEEVRRPIPADWEDEPPLRVRR